MTRYHLDSTTVFRPTGRLNSHRSSWAVSVGMVVLALWLCPAAAHAQDLDVLLGQSGSTIEEFWRQVPAVICRERVLRQRWASENGRPSSERSAEYDYLMQITLEGTQVKFEESRIPEPLEASTGDDPMLVTNGFSALLLIFHPLFQTSYRFTWDSERDAGEPVRQVHFEFIPGSRSPSVLRLRGRDYPIEWNGTAQIDLRTGRVSRIETELRSPLEDLGLNTLTASTEYQQTQFADSGESYWLPRIATIDASSLQRRWSNRHELSGCRRFSVDIRIESGAPQ